MGSCLDLEEDSSKLRTELAEKGILEKYGVRS